MITSFKLFESQFDALLEAKMWEDFKQFFVDLKSLDGVQMTDEIGQSLFAADPTEEKTYTRWLGNMFKKYNLEQFLENVEGLYDLLSTYNLGKAKLKDDYSQFKDINKIKNFEILKDVVNHIVENRYHISKESMKRARRIQTEEDYMQIHEDNEWQIIIPFTWAQSAFWAKGAKWCVSANERENMAGGGQFQNYCENLDSGGAPIYIFHHKTDEKKNHALHFGRNGRFEFQDYENRGDDFNRFIRDNRSHDFKGSLVNFWNDALKNPAKYAALKRNWPMAEILVGFVSNFLKNQSAINSNYSILGNMILESDTLFNQLKLDEKGLQDLLTPALEIGNMTLIKKILGNSKIDVNKNLSNGQTPLMTVVSSALSSDEEVKKICEYLISLGADGSGTRENGSSNLVLESLLEDKKYYKTALLLSSLPKYDPNVDIKLGKESNNLNSFLINLKIGSKTDNETISYEDFSTLLSNIVAKGFDLNQAKYGLRDMPTIVFILLQYVKSNDVSEQENLYLVMKAYFENGANPCIEFSLKPNIQADKKVLDMVNPNSQENLYKLIKKYSEMNGCA